MIPKPIEVKAIKKYKIWIKYSDSSEGKIDLSHLASQGIFKEWDTNDLFFNVYIENEFKAVAWNNQIELCPDSLFLKLKGLSFEQWNRLNNTYTTNK